jgi:hypothetical protein
VALIQRAAAELRDQSVTSTDLTSERRLLAALWYYILAGTYRLDPLNHHISVHRDRVLAEGADTA